MVKANRFLWMIVASVLATAACSSDTSTENLSDKPVPADGSSSTSSAPTSAVTSDAVEVESTTTPVDVTSSVDIDRLSIDDIDWQISWNSIGPVTVGSTLEEIESALGPEFDVVDAGVLGEAVEGYAITLHGEVLFWAGTSDADNPSFEFLITDNPRLALDSGLHPEMMLGDAVTLHGAPTFSFHTANHGREHVSFEDGLGDRSETISIQTAGTDRFQAGLYGDVDLADGYFETTEYDPSGTISLIQVSCFGPGRQGCNP